MSRPTLSDRQLDTAVGDLVRRARLSAGKTQEQLGEAIGVQPETISRYENGSIPLSLTALFRLAEALGVRVEALLPTTEDAKADAAEADLVRRWRLLDPEGRGLVSGILRRLVP